MSSETTRIAELRIDADPLAWSRCGFAVEGDRTVLGSTPVRFEPGGAGRGISGWTLSGTESAHFDGLDTELGPSGPEAGDRPDHPNTTLSIDHLVVFTPELERTIDSFEASGVRCRRVREVGPPDRLLRQAFFRFGEVICEVVEVPEDQAGREGASRFWGMTVTVADLDLATADLGERVGTIRDAIQPGRRIATIREQAGLGVPVALITPEPARSETTD